MSAGASESPRGGLILISAPSGAGKTTLVRALLERNRNIRFSVSYTTRKPRENEVPGRDYVFVDEEEFENMVRQGRFLEHANVFGNRYGTGREAVAELRAAGFSVLLEIDWQGAQQVRAAAPDAVSVFVMPPSLAVLEARLRGRDTDSQAVIDRRLSEALGDMSHWDEFDYVIVNDELGQAADELASIVAGEPVLPGTGDGRVRARIEAILGASG